MRIEIPVIDSDQIKSISLKMLDTRVSSKAGRSSDMEPITRICGIRFAYRGKANRVEVLAEASERGVWGPDLLLGDTERICGFQGHVCAQGFINVLAFRYVDVGFKA